MKAAFCTLGCKVNQYDTDAMRELFIAAGYEPVGFNEVADVYLINTCTVTATGDSKSRQMISRAHAKNPNARIVVTGCYAQRAPDEVAKLPGVVLVLGTAERLSVVERLSLLDKPEQHVEDIFCETVFEPLSTAGSGRTRAELKIQEGCDRFCTYCIIPHVRGRVRSRSLQSVAQELGKLGAAGFSEVVLTGIHLMSYGRDIPGVTILDAIALAEDVPGIRRVRLGSLEPQLLNGEFVGKLARFPKLCRQFHLSLQSGSDSVLERMGRRYDTTQYAACVAGLRKEMPGCAITTDVIAGFPGETAVEHGQTMAFVESVGFARMHVFPYSRREGTAAAKLPGQVCHKEKMQRARELIALGNRMEQEYASTYAGKTVQVLFEQKKGGAWEGYTETYVRVSVHSEADLEGKLANVQIQSAGNCKLVGKIIS